MRNVKQLALTLAVIVALGYAVKTGTLVVKAVAQAGSAATVTGFVTGKWGSSVPASCSPDGLMFFKTTAPIGWQQCTNGTYSALASTGTTINTTNGTLPKRSNATTFIDSLFSDDGTNGTVGGQLFTPAGTASTPGLASSATTSQGIRWRNSSLIDFVNGGVAYARLSQAVGNAAAFNTGSRTWCMAAGDDVETNGGDTCWNRPVAGVFALGTGAGPTNLGGTLVANGNKVVLTADWTCGTAGTVSSCTAATIIGSGGGVPLTFTLPLFANSYKWECDLVVGQATAATANSWNFLTATTGATNVTAAYQMNTAATAMTGGATTDTAATTTTVVIGPAWTLGGTGTKMPVHIWGSVEGASASGTVLSLQLVAPTVGDVVTIYRGSGCTIR